MSARAQWRIAIREEGTMLNAYWTRVDTMEGAELVASIQAELINADELLQEAWMEMIKGLSVMLVQRRLGQRVLHVETREPPTNEQTGKA